MSEATAQGVTVPPSGISITEKAGLTIPEAAELLGVSETLVRRLVRTAGFPAFQPGGVRGGKWVINRRMLLSWLDKQTEGLPA